MEDVTKFDATKYKEAVAESTGTDVSEVVVTDVDYEVKVGYDLPLAITEPQAIEAIADQQGVPESAVSVTMPNRRLRSVRWLSTISVEATITTKDSAIVSEIVEKASDTTALEESFKKTLNQDVPVEVKTAPKAIVQVETLIETVGRQPPQAPTAAFLETKLEETLGVPVKPSLENLEVERIFAESDDFAFDEETAGCLDVRSAVLFPILCLAMLIHT